MTNNNTNSNSSPRRAPSVQIAFRTLGRTLRHGYDNLGTLMISSIFWYVGVLLIIPAGTVTAALHRMTKPMSEERATDWRTFWTHFRTDLRWSSGLVLVLLLVFIIIPMNMRFYNNAGNTALQMLGYLFGTMLLIWTSVALYAFPIALRQNEQRVWQTIRNTLVITMANLPGALVSMVLLGLLCALFLFIPPLFLIIPGVVALWAQENVRMLLVASGYLAEDPIADRPRR